MASGLHEEGPSPEMLELIREVRDRLTEEQPLTETQRSALLFGHAVGQRFEQLERKGYRDLGFTSPALAAVASGDILEVIFETDLCWPEAVDEFIKCEEALLL